MKNFSWAEPKTLEQASAAMKQGGVALAGGVDLLCMLKERLEEPSIVVSLKSLSGMRNIDSGKTLRIGSLVTAEAVEKDTNVRKRARVLAQAAAGMASPQIRNVGTVGGNLCQRPRCWYFRDKDVHCMKKGGDRCYSVNGRNEYHCIIGGDPCFIVHPSDFAPALIALNAAIKTNVRQMNLQEFFVLPEKNVRVENVLQPGEIVTELEMPADWLDVKTAYFKVRERQSFDWALASCAVALKMDGKKVAAARIVLGGVAPIPWRSEQAESELVGKEVTEALAQFAGRAALADALPLADNAYKVELAGNAVKIAIMSALE